MRFSVFNTAVQRCEIDHVSRNRVVACAIGTAIARRLALPSSEVDTISGHFRLQHSETVRAIVSSANEEVIMQPKSAVEFSELMYRFRYNTAFPLRVFSQQLPYDFFCSVAGVDQFVSPEEFQFLNENRASILGLADIFEYCLKEHFNERVA